MAASASTNLPGLSKATRSFGAYQLIVIAKPGPDHPYLQLASAIQSCGCTQSILIPYLKALRALFDERNRAGLVQELKFAADYQAAGVDVTLPADEFYQTTHHKDAECRLSYIAATLVSSVATCCLDREHAGYYCSLDTPFHTVKAGSVTAVDALYEEKILDAILTDFLDDLDLLNKPMLFRGFPQSFLSVYAKRVNELAVFENQEMIAELLARLLQGTNHVDLYPFRTLPIRTILLVLRSDRLKGFKTINLSGLFVGWPEKIWMAIDVLPSRPEVVYLLRPPSAEKAEDNEAVLNCSRITLDEIHSGTG